jgi:hypothetical protein
MHSFSRILTDIEFTKSNNHSRDSPDDTVIGGVSFLPLQYVIGSVRFFENDHLDTGRAVMALLRRSDWNEYFPLRLVQLQ